MLGSLGRIYTPELNAALNQTTFIQGSADNTHSHLGIVEDPRIQKILPSRKLLREVVDRRTLLWILVPQSIRQCRESSQARYTILVDILIFLVGRDALGAKGASMNQQGRGNIRNACASKTS